jgi:hypothetical protein
LGAGAHDKPGHLARLPVASGGPLVEFLRREGATLPDGRPSREMSDPHTACVYDRATG